MDDRTTVFYVDDNPKSSRLLGSVLEECGFRVIAKNDPHEALALCKRTYFDVALLDYEMPEMSGAKLAQEIKFLVPDVPVVLLSGKSTLPSSELAFVDDPGISINDLAGSALRRLRPAVKSGTESSLHERSAPQR